MRTKATRGMPTLKRLKRGDENELEQKIRLEKVVAGKQLRLAMETEEERRTRLENDAATKRLRLVMEMEEERKARLEKMVATTQLRLTLETEEERRAKKGLGFNLDLIWILGIWIEIRVKKIKKLKECAHSPCKWDSIFLVVFPVSVTYYSLIF